MFIRAMTTNDTFTENGMVTSSTSSTHVLDFFYKMGGWGNVATSSEVLRDFLRAFESDNLLTLKAMFYHRDVREGQGRRNTFREMFAWLCRNRPDLAIKNLENVPFFGRWDDVLVALGTPVESSVADLILSALKGGDKLCAKWMPRENKKNGALAKVLMHLWGISPRSYRKLLAGNTKVVENLMCKNAWGAINYNTVPSQAISIYKNAFREHDTERFVAWVESLKKSDSGAKINAGAIYPHDIIRKSYTTATDVMEAQWKALPNYVPTGRKILPVCDVSGSMRGDPLDVCVALGIYLSERNEGIFKDAFITFSARPELQVLKGNLASRIMQLQTAKWQMNTNLEAVFRLILSKAVEARLPEKEMPDEILILSDMQFDSCVSNHSDSAMAMIDRMYKESGYRRPNIIFWNLRTSSGVPVKYDASGTAIVSGYSPSVMKSVLGGDLNPVKAMNATLNSERYSRVLI